MGASRLASRAGAAEVTTQRAGPSSEDCGMTSDVITNTECDTHTHARARAPHMYRHMRMHAKIRMCKKRHDENRTSSRESANGVLFSFSMFPLQLAAIWSPILQQTNASAHKSKRFSARDMSTRHVG